MPAPPLPTRPPGAGRRDVRIIVTATIAVLAAGIFVAALLWVGTRRDNATPKEYRPFSAGLAQDLQDKVKEGGPVFIADPFAGDRGFWIALEGNRLVAVAVQAPGNPDCAVRWRGSKGSFVDCTGDRLPSTDLDRYPTSIPRTGDDKGVFLVDLRRRIPAPGLTSTTTAPTPTAPTTTTGG